MQKRGNWILFILVLYFLVFLSNVTAESWPARINLNNFTNAGVYFYGNNSGDYFGHKQQIAIGDFNGDKINDTIIAAANSEGSVLSDTGRIYVFYGSSTGWRGFYDLRSNLHNVTIVGNETSMKLGMTLATVDINNDGYSDIIAGASPNSTFVYFGAANYPKNNQNTPNITFRGNRSDFFGARAFGQGLAVGKINGDAFGDIVISNPGMNPGGRAQAGEVYVFYGAASLPAIIRAANANFTIKGNLSNDRIGGAAESTVDYTAGADSPGSLAVGDITGDGIDDIIFGCSDCNPGGRTKAGMVFAMFGRAGLNGILDLSLGGTSVTNLTLKGNSSPDHFGSSIGLIDYDNDGDKDLIISAPNASVGGKTGGYISIIKGTAFAHNTVKDTIERNDDLTIKGNQTGFLLGQTIGVADIDNDRLGDFFFTGANYSNTASRTMARGYVYGVYGRAGLKSFNMSEFAPNITIAGNNTQESGNSLTFGLGLASGDIDRDGFQDLLIGDSMLDIIGGRSNTLGTVYAIFGNHSGICNVNASCGCGHKIMNTKTLGPRDAIGNMTCRNGGLTFNVSGITLEGSNRNMTGSFREFGINITDFDRITIKNLVINRFLNGINISRSENNTILNITTNFINASNSGSQLSAFQFFPAEHAFIHLTKVNHTNISSNTILIPTDSEKKMNRTYGIRLRQTNNISIRTNRIRTIVVNSGPTNDHDATAGVFLGPNARNSSIKKNNITLSGFYAILLNNSFKSNISFNSFNYSGNFPYSTQVAYSLNSTLIKIFNSSNNSFFSNRFLRTSSDAGFNVVINGSTSHNNTFINNTFHNNSVIAFRGSVGSSNYILKKYLIFNLTKVTSGGQTAFTAAFANKSNTSTSIKRISSDANGFAKISLTEKDVRASSNISHQYAINLSNSNLVNRTVKFNFSSVPVGTGGNSIHNGTFETKYRVFTRQNTSYTGAAGTVNSTNINSVVNLSIRSGLLTVNSSPSGKLSAKVAWGTFNATRIDLSSSRNFLTGHNFTGFNLTSANIISGVLKVNITLNSTCTTITRPYFIASLSQDPKNIARNGSECSSSSSPVCSDISCSEGQLSFKVGSSGGGIQGSAISFAGGTRSTSGGSGSGSTSSSSSGAAGSSSSSYSGGVGYSYYYSYSGIPVGSPSGSYAGYYGGYTPSYGGYYSGGSYYGGGGYYGGYAPSYGGGYYGGYTPSYGSSYGYYSPGSKEMGQVFMREGKPMKNFAMITGDHADVGATQSLLDIALNLQEGQSVIYAIEREEKNFATPENTLSFNTTLGQVKPALQDKDLSILKTRDVFSFGKTSYLQTIEFNNSAGFLSNKIVYDLNEKSDPGDYFFIKQGSDAFKYKLTFEEGLSSRVTNISSKTDMIDLIDSDYIYILGTPFKIANATIDSSKEGEVSLLLMNGEVEGVLDQKETKTYSLSSGIYTITALAINEQGVLLKVNDQSLPVLSSSDFYQMPGLNISIRDVLISGKTSQPMLVRFFLNGKTVRFTDSNYSDKTDKGSSVFVNGEFVDDGRVSISAFVSQQRATITEISYTLAGRAREGNIYLAPGQSLSDIQFERAGLITDKFDLYFEGMADPGGSGISITPEGKTQYYLEFTNFQNTRYKVPYLTTERNGSLRFGKFNGGQDNNLVFIEGNGANESRIWYNDYFIISDISTLNTSVDTDALRFDKGLSTDNYGITKVLQYQSFDATNKVLSFIDIGLNNSPVHTTVDSNGNGTLRVAGVNYLVKVNTSSRGLNIDLNSDGKFTQRASVIAIPGGGLIGLGNRNPRRPGNTGILPGTNKSMNMSIITLNKAFIDPRGSQNYHLIIPLTQKNSLVNINFTNATGIFFKSMKDYPDVKVFRDSFGIRFLILNTTTEMPPSLFIYYPLAQVNVVLKAKGGELDEKKEYVTRFQKLSPDTLKLASEVSDVRQLNTVLLGNACDNFLIAKLLNYPEPCYEDLSDTRGEVKMFKFPNGTVSLVFLGKTSGIVKKTVEDVLAGRLKFNFSSSKRVNLMNNYFNSTLEVVNINVDRSPSSQIIQECKLLKDYVVDEFGINWNGPTSRERAFLENENSYLFLKNKKNESLSVRELIYQNGNFLDEQLIPLNETEGLILRNSRGMRKEINLVCS